MSKKKGMTLIKNTEEIIPVIRDDVFSPCKHSKCVQGVNHINSVVSMINMPTIKEFREFTCTFSIRIVRREMYIP